MGYILFTLIIISFFLGCVLGYFVGSRPLDVYDTDEYELYDDEMDGMDPMVNTPAKEKSER